MTRTEGIAAPVWYHRHMRLVPLLPLAVLTITTGCPARRIDRPYPAPTGDELLGRLAKQRTERTAFTAESTMEYWLGKQRVKGTVLVMATTGKKVRFNALSPAGGSVLADMACDGANFAFVDSQNNCQLTGPCDRSSIAAFLGVELEPEDFLYMALGTVPVIEGASTVTWDSTRGLEKVVVTGAAGKQTIAIDAKDGRLDVIGSALVDTAGKTVWSVDNTEFETASDAAGGKHRVPSKSRLRSPGQQADLVVEWGDRTLNPTLDDARFVVEVPTGLPRCR